ncbi:MAG: acyl-CoA dehydrogenase family protein, partial [Tsuneonella suprasediminis]
MNEWIGLSEAAALAARSYVGAVQAKVAAVVAPADKIDPALADRHQHILHGFAWIATTAEALAAVSAWARRCGEAGQFGTVEQLALRVGFGEYCAQLIGGVPMSQSEFARPAALGVADDAARFAASPAVARFMADGNTPDTRAALAALLAEGAVPDEGLGDDTMDMIRTQFRTFARERIAPHAHKWHLADTLIPIE